MKISIAMATYNGEEYIQEQLDSFLTQTRLPDELIITDDCSTDRTSEIVNYFASKAPFRVEFHRNEERLGYADNFLKAATLCGGDWVAFSDQDDVWLPDKLKLAEERIIENPSVFLILQNAIITDEALNDKGGLFPNRIKPGFYQRFTQNGFWVWVGFLQTVNASIFKDFDCVKRPLNSTPRGKIMAHDKWVCMIANVVGGIEVLSDPVAMYRRHSGAVTGSYDDTTFSSQAKLSLSYGEDHYLYMSNVARGISEYFFRHQSLVGRAAEDATRKYEDLADRYRSRADFYSENNLKGRVNKFMKVAARSGYLGDRFSSFGVKALAKDLYTLVLGSKAGH